MSANHIKNQKVILQKKCAKLPERQRLLIETIISDAQIAVELSGNDFYSEFARLTNENTELSNASRRVVSGMIKLKIAYGVSEVLHEVNLQRNAEIAKMEKLEKDLEAYFGLKKWQKILNGTWFEKRKWLDSVHCAILQVSNGVSEASGNIILAVREFKKTGKDELTPISDTALKDFKTFEELTVFLEAL